MASAKFELIPNSIKRRSPVPLSEKPTLTARFTFDCAAITRGKVGVVEGSFDRGEIEAYQGRLMSMLTEGKVVDVSDREVLILNIKELQTALDGMDALEIA